MALSLAIDDLDAGYGAVKALRGVSLHVGAGETVALLGTNGNGKSTLMKCVMGLVRPSAGRIVAETQRCRRMVTKAGKRLAAAQHQGGRRQQGKKASGQHKRSLIP